MIKAVIFDCGGVLKANTDEYIFKDIANAFGMEAGEVIDQIRDIEHRLEKGEITEEECWKEFSKEVGKELPKDFAELWSREYKARYSKREDVIRIAKELKKKGYTVAMLSNTTYSHAKHNREQGMYDTFEPCILSNEVKYRKPEPEIFKITIERIGCMTEECVFIDDKEEYIKVAEKLGMKGIVFRNAKQLEEELKKLGLEF